MSKAMSLILNISESRELKVMWDKYRKEFSYSENISFEDIVNTINEILIFN
ncbi:MAG: hypothetical protein IKN85_13135 [Oscillospiraceae bacterium]|nr:hypothetical protein [Oscillospiraceae bacterium]